MRYFGVEKGLLVPRTNLTLDISNYKVVEDKKRYQVSMNSIGTKFLIDVGYNPAQRATIICEDISQLIYALGLVRVAFPSRS
jgi:hypothetical protein